MIRPLVRLPLVGFKCLLGALLVACSAGGTGGAQRLVQAIPDAAPRPDRDAGSDCLETCPPGTRRCGPQAQVQICGDFSGGGCPSWGGDVTCPAGSGCLDGVCAPICADACVAGEAVCAAEGRRICADENGDGCLEFAAPAPCAADERCDGGACVPADAPCADECAPVDAEICEDAHRTRRCGQYDADACLDLSPPVACAGTESCVDGLCVPVCSDECVLGADRCAPEGVQRCGNFDADACLEFSAPAACPADQRCDDGACVPATDPCADACVAGERRCAEGGPQACGNFDDDVCLEWSAAAPCPADQHCGDAAACVPDAMPCADACAPGETTCAGGGVSACADSDGDGCLDFGPATPCPDGQTCSAGLCGVECQDDCAALGLSECSAAQETRACGQYDADPCLDWSSPSPCGAAEACQDGLCVALCTDECALGDRRCGGDGFQLCGDFDADPCLEMGGGQACGPGEACLDGACQIACADECAAGAADCVALGARGCGNFDADPCLDWSAPRLCGAWQTCEVGACTDRPIPPGVLINEVRAQAMAPDGTSEAFIELSGPPGTPLEGFTLVGINGNGGGEYVEIHVAGNLDAMGLHVIAHPDALALAGAADQLDVGADLQDGPDSVQLRWGATVVDALAYGDFGQDAIAAGEGAPAAAPGPDLALSRDAAHRDTDDNRTDFRAVTPSPGEVRPCVDGCAVEAELRCAAEVAMRCDPTPGGCLDWAVLADCGAGGQLCRAGACEARPVCVVPTGVVETVPVDGIFANFDTIDALPIAGGGFAIGAGAPTRAMTFTLTDAAGHPQTPVQGFGPTDFPPWGGGGVYYPELFADANQFWMTWSGFSNQGNRDIHLRRFTLQGQVIPTANSVISAGAKGFSPLFQPTAAGVEVIYNRYRQLRRIPLGPLGDPAAAIDLGAPHGDTREEGFMATAQTDAGSRAILYGMNSVDFNTPHTYFQALTANNVAVGARVDLGESPIWGNGRSVYLFALPGDRYGAVYRTYLGAARQFSATYAVLSAAGVVLSAWPLSEMAPPDAYRPAIDPRSVVFDGARIGVMHVRALDPLEPSHTAIQWLTPDGAHIARTELGALGGVLVRHPDDGLFRLLEPRGLDAPVRMHRLGCP